MTLVAPVIGAVPGGIFHHADANFTKLSGAPNRFPCLARMLCADDGLPIDRLEWNVLQLHLRHRWRKAAENLQEPRMLDIAAAKHHGNILFGHSLTLLQ